MAKQATLVWSDVAGSAVLNVVRTAGGIGGIETALQAHSNAAIVTCSEGVLEIYAATPSNAWYPLVTTTAVLIFQDSLGSQGRLYLPSPDQSIFMSDMETVNPTAVTDIISAAIGNLLSGSGSTVTTFVKGYLQKGKVTGYASTM